MIGALRQRAVLAAIIRAHPDKLAERGIHQFDDPPIILRALSCRIVMKSIART